LPEPGKGSEGYAAPEIWQKQLPSVGSDRTAMAILIQELLVVGDPDITKSEALDWGYDQESRLFEWTFNQEKAAHEQRGDVHPLLARKHPDLAKLMRDTLSASGPETRPAPQSWRKPLRDMAVDSPQEIRRGLLVEADPIDSSRHGVSFAPARDSLDLSSTDFRIRATLERGPNGSIFLLVHAGATLNVQSPGSKRWIRYSGGARVPADLGTIVFDQDGALKVRLNSPR
jgi:hypothetical protein